jgi:hypothetical protein
VPYRLRALGEDGTEEYMFVEGADGRMRSATREELAGLAPLRRKLETHPTTGAAQLVEVRECVQEIVVPAYVPRPAAVGPRPPLFADLSDAQILALGVPPEWLADVRQATEDTVLGLAEHLPAEAAEALLELATGGTPRQAPPAAPAGDPFEHPDARRRFRVVTDVEELARGAGGPLGALDCLPPPAQRDLVERRFGGPARINEADRRASWPIYEFHGCAVGAARKRVRLQA